MRIRRRNVHSVQSAGKHDVCSTLNEPRVIILALALIISD